MARKTQLKTLHPGDRAPAFALKSQSGEKVTLSSLKGKTVVLYFYPKDHTSGCTREGLDFEALRSKFTKKGAVIIGVSRDSVESHLKFCEKQGYGFTLLSDPDAEMCEAYGVYKEKSMYGRKYMGIERTTFIINPQGKIVSIFEKVKVPGHAQAVLEQLDEEAP